MKKIKYLWILWVVIGLAAIVCLFNSFYVVAENEYVCILRFSKFTNVTSEAGLHFKIPFIDTTMSFPKTALLYDIPPSEVFTADKKTMTVDSYVLWEINDPQTFYQTIGNTTAAQDRLNAVTYNALKNLMGTLEQNDIINEHDAAERNDIYESITSDVAEVAQTYGITVLDVKIKRFDLPDNNEQAVYERMISERNQIAEKYIADGNYEASIIRNDVDKQVNISISDAEAKAAALEAEGEKTYMEMLAEAYNTDEKREFYEFTLALDALKAALDGEDKTVIIGKDSALDKFLLGSAENVTAGGEE